MAGRRRRVAERDGRPPWRPASPGPGIPLAFPIGGSPAPATVSGLPHTAERAAHARGARDDDGTPGPVAGLDAIAAECLAEYDAAASACVWQAEEAAAAEYGRLLAELGVVEEEKDGGWDPDQGIEAAPWPEPLVPAPRLNVALEQRPPRPSRRRPPPGPCLAAHTFFSPPPPPQQQQQQQQRKTSTKRRPRSGVLPPPRVRRARRPRTAAPRPLARAAPPPPRQRPSSAGLVLRKASAGPRVSVHRPASRARLRPRREAQPKRTGMSGLGVVPTCLDRYVGRGDVAGPRRHRRRDSSDDVLSRGGRPVVVCSPDVLAAAIVARW